MVNDDAHTRDWAQGKPRNKLELRLIASTEWCHGKNIPAIHTLISDDDILMKNKDDCAGDNYVDENDENNFAICSTRFLPLCGFWLVPVPSGALEYITWIRHDKHTVFHEMLFVSFRSGHAPSFLMVSICVQFLFSNFSTFTSAFEHLFLCVVASHIRFC